MTGVDTILDSLKTKIADQLPYINKVYGRAQVFRENVGGHGLLTIPKAHVGNGEYEYCLPQDTNQAQTYFIAASKEKYDEFDRVNIGKIHRTFALTIWGTLGENGVPDTLEEIKFECIAILQKSPYVSDIDSYADEEYSQVFPEFAYWLGRSATKSLDKKEADTNWLMYPNAGFRLLFTISYIQPCASTNTNNGFNYTLPFTLS